MHDSAIHFRADAGLWWPDYDHNPVKNVALVKRNLTDIDIAAARCASRRVCVQAGAHAGLWPKRLSELFGQVYAFEPDLPLYECAVKNLAGIENVTLVHGALGAAPGRAMFEYRSSAGSGRLTEAGTLEVPVSTIDDLNLTSCGVIYLDVEGTEPEVLRGAARTIAKFSPILHVELLPCARDDIGAMMEGFGYSLIKKVHKDGIYAKS